MGHYGQNWGSILTRNDVVFDGSLALVANDDAVTQAVGDGVPADHGAAAAPDVHPTPLVAADCVVCNQSVNQSIHNSVNQPNNLFSHPAPLVAADRVVSNQSVSQSVNKSFSQPINQPG